MGGRYSHHCCSSEGGGGDKGSKTRPVTFADFSVVRAIGKGSFGKVCIVRKRHGDKRLFAMKYMNKAMCIQRDAYRNVLREIEILVQVDHPFLVNIWYTFQDDEDMFIVTDLLLGGDLRYHLNQEGRFAEDRTKLYICEMALALDYLKRKRIVHRDLKPDNVLLDDHGHIHLTDFNVATVLSEDSLATLATGTRPYMAPEVYATSIGQCLGYSFDVDWWSLGVCMYEMLRGRRPFDVSHRLTTQQCHDVVAKTPLAIPVDWSRPLITFLTKLLTVDPAKRITDLNTLQEHTYMERIKFKDVHCGRRPFDVSHRLTTQQCHDVVAKTPLAIPVDWSRPLITFLTKLLTVDPAKRITDLNTLQEHTYIERIKFKDVHCGRRPFDVSHLLTTQQCHDVVAKTPLAIPVDWSRPLITFLTKLLTVDPAKRITDLNTLQEHTYMERIKFKDVLRRKMEPVFIPSADKLNCDPTFELEEMIIESKPLRHKKKRLSVANIGTNGGKRADDTPGQGGTDIEQTTETILEQKLRLVDTEFKVYNREHLLKDEEERIRKLEAELGIRPADNQVLVKRLGDP